VIVFAAQPYFERFAGFLADNEPDVAAGVFQRTRFMNGEMCMSVRTGVTGQDCLVIGSMAPPDNQALEFLMLADALKRAGAATVWGCLPYLAYTRQDKSAPGRSGGIATVGALCRAAGLDGLVTIDLHSELAKHLAGLPLESLTPFPDLFTEEITSLGWPDITIAAPDSGALPRNQELARSLGLPDKVVHASQHYSSLSRPDFEGDIGSNVVLADDILDSGRTLVSACNVLRQRGARRIAIAVTHGLFAGSIWRELFGIGVTDLFVTDSCPQALQTEQPEVHVVSIKPLLAKLLQIVRKEAAHEPAYT